MIKAPVIPMDVWEAIDALVLKATIVIHMVIVLRRINVKHMKNKITKLQIIYF